MCIKRFETLTPDDKRVVMAFADGRMKMKEAARKERYAYTTVIYHLTSVRAKTGLDPRNFHDLAQLVQAIKDERKEYEQQDK